MNRTSLTTHDNTTARVWVLLCALLGAAGWLLSAISCLNATGYSIALGVIGVILYAVFGKGSFGFNPARLKRRFTRPFAAGFLILAMLSLLGGLLYAPVFFDGMAYRTTRVLNWLAEGHWWWIPDFRGWLNTRSTAYEWVTAPVLALFKTDRFLFLINIVSFLLLPGLTYSFLTRCGIGKRAAWYWMWLLPTGYGYLLQSGSIGNDLFGSVFALTAVDFALRAKKSGRASDLMFSILAIAMATGSKASNLPLLLPWLLMAVLSWKLLFKKLGVTIICSALAASCSFLPVAINNYRFCGDWTGQRAENAFSSNKAPALFVTRGVLLLAAQNLNPPVFPLAGKTEDIINELLPDRINNWFIREQPYPGWERITFSEIVAEEMAGFGFGLSLLLIIQVMLFLGRKKKVVLHNGEAFPQRLYRFFLLASPFFSLLVFMSKSGLTPVARTIMPYYALMLPLCLIVSGVESHMRRRWWQRLGICVFLIAGFGLVMIPERPLWPALTVLNAIETRSQSPSIARAKAVYETYRNRNDVLSPLIAALPPDTKSVGLVSVTEPEASLWRPFGSRRVFHVLQNTTPDELTARGVEWVIVSNDMATEVLKAPLEDWLARFNGRIEKSVSIRVFASGSPNTYLLVRIATDKPPGDVPKSP